MKFLATILLLFAIAMLLPSFRKDAGKPVTYYISQTGNDNNRGTSIKQAWKSIDKLNRTNVLPGTTILFKAGETFTGTLLLDSTDKTSDTMPITISSFGKGRAIISSGDSAGIKVSNLGYVVIKHLVLKGKDKFTNKSNGVLIENTLPGNVKLKSIRIENVDASGYGHSGIFITGQPADRSLSGYADVLVSHCNAFDNLHFGMLVSGRGHHNTGRYANSNFKVTHCKFYSNSGDPKFLENHSGSGICIDNMENGIIEYTIAYNNGYLCNSREGGPVGIWFHAANKCIIQYCASFNNRIDKGLDGGGFDFDAGVTNSIMQYNYSSNNDGPGYLLYTYSGGPHSFNNNIVRYNVSENDAHKNSYAGIWIRNDGNGIKDLAIYNNTIITRPQQKGNPSGIYIAKTENVRVFNNIIVSTDSVPLVTVSDNQPGLAFTNNNYWSTNNKFKFYADAKGYNPQSGTVHTTFSNWQKATGLEMNNEKSTAFLVDPQFERMNANDTIADISFFNKLTAYRLMKGSALIDAGVNFKSASGANDIMGTLIPHGKTVDLGAYEFKGLPQ